MSLVLVDDQIYVKFKTTEARPTNQCTKLKESSDQTFLPTTFRKIANYII